MSEDTKTEVVTTGGTPTGTKADRRRHLGRRTSDWMLPLMFAAFAILALAWGVDSYRKRKQIEEMNKTIATQAKLMERIINHQEKVIEKKLPPAPLPSGKPKPKAPVAH